MINLQDRLKSYLDFKKSSLNQTIFHEKEIRAIINSFEKEQSQSYKKMANEIIKNYFKKITLQPPKDFFEISDIQVRTDLFAQCLESAHLNHYFDENSMGIADIFEFRSWSFEWVEKCYKGAKSEQPQYSFTA